MGERGSSTGPRAGNDNATRTQLGPFWLWYRAERDEWCVCWYDHGGTAGSRRPCRKATGVTGSGGGRPPEAALDALAAHYEAWRKPVEQPINEAYVEGLMADWLLRHAKKNLADPVRYANSIAHWQRFFVAERRSGMLTGEPVVSDVKRAMIDRFVTFRERERVSRATISRDIAALRQSLNWSWKNEIIASAPFVPDITDKPGPKSLVYSTEQVAALLKAAWALEERQHVHLFTMIMLSTHGRGEAILELDADTQIQDGLIYFNAPGRRQTKKRRSIVPVAPTLAPWLVGLKGRVIQWQKRRIDPTTKEPVFQRLPANSIKNAFESSLLAAGIAEHALDSDGEPIWLPPRKKLGETAPRPLLVGLG